MKLLDVVTWKSQAGGNVTTKTGEIVEVAPPNVRPDKKDGIKGCGSARLHESYVVQVDGRYYWPLVSRLKLVKESETASAPVSVPTSGSEAAIPSAEVVVESSAGMFREEDDHDHDHSTGDDDGDGDIDESDFPADRRGATEMAGDGVQYRHDLAMEMVDSIEAPTMFRPEDGWVVLGSGG
jgi:hypothetical protein